MQDADKIFSDCLKDIYAIENNLELRRIDKIKELRKIEARLSAIEKQRVDNWKCSRQNDEAKKSYF